MFSLNIEKKQDDVFQTHKKWDMLVIGGGPAGLNGALYAKRKGLSVGIIAKETGGQLHNTSEVDNYLGFQNTTGEQLAHTFLSHVKALDVPVLQNQYVTSIVPMGHDYEVNLSNGVALISKTVLLTTGGKPRMLDVPGEKGYANKGVSYCTTRDAPFFKDKDVIVAGGGNSAAEAVIDLSVWAKSVTVVHRSKWRADQIILDKLNRLKNVEVHLNTQILEIVGQDKMTGVKVLDKSTQTKRDIKADGIFIEIGTIPNSQLIEHLVETNEHKEVIVDDQQMTSRKGLFAAGDVTNQPFKQIIISAAEGAKAALAATQYLTQEYKGE